MEDAIGGNVGMGVIDGAACMSVTSLGLTIVGGMNIVLVGADGAGASMGVCLVSTYGPRPDPVLRYGTGAGGAENAPPAINCKENNSLSNLI